MSESDPLGSIPSLIPLPSTSSSTQPNAPGTSGRNSVAHVKDESDIDKFATLFSPQTPPASPTLPIFSSSKPTTTVRSTSFNPKTVQIHAQNSTHGTHESFPTPGSAESDFGFFVSVPSTEDPLSESFFPGSTPPLGLATSQLSQLTSSSSPNSTQAPTPPSRSTHTQNPSLDFFGQFTETAKERNSGKGRSYLEELLQHEDDPLYWVKPEGGASGDDSTKSSNGDSIGAANSKPVDSGHKPEESLLDLDIDIDPRLSSNGHASTGGQTAEKTRQTSPPKKPFATPSLSPTFSFVSRSPPRPRVPHRPTSTSPTASISGPLSDSSPSIIRASSSSSVPASPTLLHENPLTSLSSRWMSSLLTSSRPVAPSTSAEERPSLDAIFAARSSSFDDLPHATSRSQTSRPVSTSHPTAVSSLKPQHAYTIPTPTSTSGASLSNSATSSISHGTPFGSRPYIPPSGAPGFTGDHTWDKGFSQDFDKERVEKKSVKLEGRRAMTTPILDSKLVDFLRPHLPALARLPRTWSLLYSLDQHGISLNTLYTRCELQGPTTSHPKGSLIVMKDSDDAIFGAWLGESVRISRGSYYGSGESFLWRYINGKLDVFNWTGKNDYVAMCEPGYLSFGGGDGRYGLYLGDTLLDGSSARCPTFENEPLCSPGSKKGGNVSFECVGLEVWGVGPT